jgi:hypothetical protein
MRFPHWPFSQCRPHNDASKQQQMNVVLKQVVDALDSDTLLVALGDHGMDPKGDHSGGSDIVTLKSLLVSGSIQRVPCYPRRIHRHPISHIKPSLANDLCTVRYNRLISCQRSHFLDFQSLLTTSEWLDHSGSDYAKALDVNAHQVHAYLKPNGTAFRAVRSMAYGVPWKLLGHVSMPASQRIGQERQSISPVSR